MWKYQERKEIREAAGTRIFSHLTATMKNKNRNHSSDEQFLKRKWIRVNTQDFLYSHWTKTFVSYLVVICADTRCPHIVQNDAINHLPAEELTACRNVLAGACLCCPWLQKDHSSSSRWRKPEFTSFQTSISPGDTERSSQPERKPPRPGVKVTEATLQQLWNCDDTS